MDPRERQMKLGRPISLAAVLMVLDPSFAASGTSALAGAWKQQPVSIAPATQVRTEEVRRLLNISLRQEGAWREYADALAAYRAAMRRQREAEVHALIDPGDRSMSSAESLDSRMNPDAESNDAKAKLRAAFEILYARLTLEQQQTADRTLTSGECGR
jgi:hypothetical protein